LHYNTLIFNPLLLLSDHHPEIIAIIDCFDLSSDFLELAKIVIALF